MLGPLKPSLAFAGFFLSPLPAYAQVPGTLKKEYHPPMPLTTCTKAGGCTADPQTTVTMDANWRWLRKNVKGQYDNCFTQQNTWDCPGGEDPESCSKMCALEGVNTAEMKSTYGVTSGGGALRLSFHQQGA